MWTNYYLCNKYFSITIITTYNTILEIPGYERGTNLLEIRKWHNHLLIREKGRGLTQSYVKSPYTNRNIKRAK